MRHLIVAAAKTAIASAVVTVCGFVSIKVLAILLGPSGIGLYSLLRQCVMTATVLATFNPQAALAHAVVEGERHGSLDRRLSAVFWTVLSIAAAVIGIAMWCSGAIAGWLLPDLPSAGRTVALLAIPVAINAVFIVLLNVLQGFRAVGAASIASIAGGVTTALLAYPLGLRASAGDFSALVILLAAGPLVSVLAAGVSGWRAGWLLPAVSAWAHLDVDSASIRSFLRISGGGLLASVLTAASLLIVRTLVAGRIGLDAAGVFDAAWTVSHTCFGLMLAAFGSYYLPTLIRLRESADFRRLINQALFLVTVAALPAIVAAIAFRAEIVTLLYSSDFLAANGPLRWLLLGQCFRLAAWTLSFVVLARAQMRVIVLSEAMWCVAFVATAVSGLDDLASLEMLGFAYAIVYGLYFLFFAIFVQQSGAVRLASGVVLVWAGGLAISFAAALLLFDAAYHALGVRLACCAAALAFSAVAWSSRRRVLMESESAR